MTDASPKDHAASAALLEELVAAHQQLVAAVGAGHEAEIDLADERINEIMRQIRAARVK